jgi:hypothetical protein
MAKSKGFTVDSKFFLQLSLGAFFLILGIKGFGDYDSGLSKFLRAFGNDDTFKAVIAVVELIMGGILVAGLFFTVPANLARIMFLALFVIWAGIILYFNVIGTEIEDNFVPWCYEISWRCVILVGLWIVGKKYA